MPKLCRRGFLLTALTGAAAWSQSKLKVTSVEASPLKVREPLANNAVGTLSDFDPRRWRSFGPFSQLGGAILVRIRTDQGLTGYGMGGGGGAACYIIENHLRSLLVGVNPLNVEVIWDQLFSSTSFYGRRGVAIQAISGIDLALWDIAGKHAGVPVYRLLGGPTQDRVPGYYTGNDIERGLKLGFGAVKIAGFADFRSGRAGLRKNVERIIEARRRIGPEPLLMLDALCAWDVPYTLELADRVAEARLHFLEEPLLPDEVAGYARLCREIRSTQIASGEHEATVYGFQELLRNKAADVLQPDVTWSGGLTDCRRVAAACEAAGAAFVPHRGGSVYGMTLILTCRSAHLAESFGTGGSGNEIMELLTPKLEKGYYLPPVGPGFGVGFTDRIVRKYAPQLT
jgi:L-rhamnonate dehydratase